MVRSEEDNLEDDDKRSNKKEATRFSVKRVSMEGKDLRMVELTS